MRRVICYANVQSREGSSDRDGEDEDSLNNGDLWPNYINKSATFLDYLNDAKKDI